MVWDIDHELAANGLVALSDKGYRVVAHAKPLERGRGKLSLRRLTVPTRNSAVGMIIAALTNVTAKLHDQH